MGLTHIIERSLERDTFEQLLDLVVPDWTIKEAKCFVRLALKCSKLKQKDRPDLGTVILPELDRLRAIAEETVNLGLSTSSPSHSPTPSQISVQLEDLVSTL